MQIDDNSIQRLYKDRDMAEFGARLNNRSVYAFMILSETIDRSIHPNNDRRCMDNDGDALSIRVFRLD